MIWRSQEDDLEALSINTEKGLLPAGIRKGKKIFL
jgi:hypothetical protein